MEPHINEALTDAVRRWAKPTTPEDLQRRGIRRIRSISLTRVASLIEKAVNRTMLARTLGDVPDDAESFSFAARTEFLRMMGQSPSTRDDPLQGQAATALERLKQQVAERRRIVEEKRRSLEAGDGAVGAGDIELERKLRDLFLQWGGSATDPSPLEREVIRIAVDELRKERASSERARLDDHQRQIDTLERRIAKLNRLLGETEAELQRAVRKAVVEPGKSSMYDTVQGLDAMDEQFEKKTRLMTAIFEANLEMRAALEAAR